MGIIIEYLSVVFNPRISPAWARESLPLTRIVSSMTLPVCNVVQKLLAHDGCPLQSMGVIFSGDSLGRSQGRGSFLWVKHWLSFPCPVAPGLLHVCRGEPSITSNPQQSIAQHIILSSTLLCNHESCQVIIICSLGTSTSKHYIISYRKFSFKWERCSGYIL